MKSYDKQSEGTTNTANSNIRSCLCRKWPSGMAAVRRKELKEMKLGYWMGLKELWMEYLAMKLQPEWEGGPS